MKYIKPNSLTWWSSMAPLTAGLFMATEPLHGMSGAVESLYVATGMTAPVLINMGLIGIGVRAAIK